MGCLLLQETLCQVCEELERLPQGGWEADYHSAGGSMPLPPGLFDMAIVGNRISNLVTKMQVGSET